MSGPERPIQMAVIGAPHGVRGELRVKSFTGDPLALAGYSPLYTAGGRRLDVAAIRSAGNVVVVRFDQVGDRTAAEALTGEALFVDRAALPEDLEDDEYYHADLVGLAVFDTGGNQLGKVAAFHDFGGGDVMEIALQGRGTALVPFTAAAVPHVDVAGGHVTLDPEAAGLVSGSGEGPDFDPGRRPRGPRGAGGNR